MHGSLTAAKIQICIKFYTALFKERCGLSWAQARQNALQYDPFINRTFPDYEAEMRGIAKGAKVDYEDVLALNVRTELVFGTFMDGCTALSWKTKEINVVAQNWDVSLIFRNTKCIAWEKVYRYGYANEIKSGWKSRKNV